MGNFGFFNKIASHCDYFFWKKDRDFYKKSLADSKRISEVSVCGVEIEGFNNVILNDSKLDKNNLFVKTFIKSEEIMEESLQFLNKIEMEAENEAKKILGIE